MIGESLRQGGIVTETDLQSALIEHKRSGERLGSVLIRLGMATERQIAKALADQLGFPYVELVASPPDPAVVVRIPKEIALGRNCIAVAVEKNVLTVAMSDPLMFTLVQDLEFRTGYRIKQVVATRDEIIEAIHLSYPDKALVPTASPAAGTHDRDAALVRGPAGADVPPADGVRSAQGPDEDVFERQTGPESDTAQDQTAEVAPIIDMVELVIQSAIKSGASDVHIEPNETKVIVRNRLDGLLKEVMDLPKWVHEGVVARIKIMAGMDIAEKRLPQDGRIRAEAAGGQHIDLRVSTLRTIFGEKVVLRVLDQRKGVPPLEELGFSIAALAQFHHFLRHQHGMILVVGPTGSGKTTTLSSALASVRSERTNIITVEDPVEYQIPGVNQTQINAKIDLTFASALRSILRQDPDVVLVGEIRDRDTAQIAMQAAQTGHLVLSTLHTDDAPSTVTRLTDIGIESYVSASALLGVIAQRLVRRLCTNCRSQYTPEAETLRAMGITDAEAASLVLYRAVGCDLCNQTGYRGRLGIYEIMPVTDELRRHISMKGGEALLRDAALAAGMISLGEDGLQKVKAGVTSPQELLRVVTEVREVKAACPECGAGLARDFLVCPACGHGVSGTCPQCSRPKEPGWKFCPYCAKSTAASKAASTRRRKALEGETAVPALPPARNVAEFKK
jgi:type IV pilus assembly protein PilB